MPRRPTRRYRRKAPKRKSKPVAKLSKPMRRAIKQVIKGQAETKHTSFYQTYNPGTPPPVVATGLYASRGYALQNNVIANNISDILQLVPYVTQGTDNWNRLGQKITVQNLTLHGSVRVALPILQAVPLSLLSNLKVVIYVLQHRTLKSYDSLRSLNNFNQLLDTGEGTTAGFGGQVCDDKMPVSSNYYTVCHRKVIRLKWAGVQPNSTSEAPVTSLSIANCGEWKADFTIDLTKDIPKVLEFPDQTSPAVPLPPTTVNAPTNSSLFMCMGFINDGGPSNLSAPTVGQIEQTYVSRLLFKDL